MPRLLLIFVALVLAAAAARAQDKPADAQSQAAPATAAPPPKPGTPEKVADRFLAAFRAKEEEAMKSLGESREPDPFLVADALYGRHVAGSLKEPPEPGDFLAAAAAYAERAKGWKGAEALPILVDRWKGLKRGDLEREARLRAALARVQDTAGGTAPVDASVIVRDQSEDIAAAKGSVTAARLQSSAVVAHFSRGELPEALSLTERFREACIALGDRTGAASAQADIGVVYSSLGQFAKAMENLEPAQKEAALLGNRVGAAQVLAAISSVHWRRGEFARALDLNQQALREFEALNYAEGVAVTLGNIGVMYEALSDYAKAVEYHERSVAAEEARGNREGAAISRGNIGAAYQRIGEHAKALEYLEGALAVHRELGLRGNVAAALGLIADVHFDLGRYEKALAYDLAALKEYEALKNPVGAADELRSIGIIHGRLGRYALALEYLERAHAEMKTMGVRAEAAATLGCIGQVHDALGQYEKALEYQERAREGCEAAGDRAGAAAWMGNVGSLQSKLGRHAEALEATKASRSALLDLRRHSEAAAMLLHVAGAYGALGQHENARKCYEQAVLENEEVGARHLMANALAGLARVWERLGPAAKALEYGERSLREAEALGDRGGESTALGLLARIHRTAGRHADALACVRRGLAMESASTAGLGEEEARKLRSDASAASDLGLLALRDLRAPGAALRPGEPAEALALIEQGRALLLAEGLVNREALLGAALPPGLRERELAARESMAASRRDWTRIATRKGASVAELQGAKESLDAAYRGLEEVVARVQRESRRVAGVVYPTAIGLEDARRALPEGTDLVLYQETDERILAFCVTSREAVLVDLAESAPVRDKARAWRDLLAAGDESEQEAAAALYDVLLRPLEKFAAGSARLLVSPDGALTFLPFDALLRVEGERRERALQRWEFAYVPSATVLGALQEDSRAPPGAGVVALGDPVYPGEAERGIVVASVRDAEMRGLGDLGRLPASGEEASAVARLFPEERRKTLLRGEASLDGLRKALGSSTARLRAVHLACHGLVDAERPRLTGLVLSGGEVLSLDEVYRLNLSADLVVLSACETAKGKLEKGEGVMGLVRGFFFAGAPRVIASLWKVDDEATKALMVKFYELWNPKDGSKGLGAAAALKKAQEFVASHEKWKHPKYWAAWVLWGLPE